MNFKTYYDPKTLIQLKKLPKETRKRILEKMKTCAQTQRGIETLENNSIPHKIRVGDYRVLLDITYNPNIFWIRYIGHRKNVYKNY